MIIVVGNIMIYIPSLENGLQPKLGEMGNGAEGRPANCGLGRRPALRKEEASSAVRAATGAAEGGRVARFGRRPALRKERASYAAEFCP